MTPDNADIASSALERLQTLEQWRETVASVTRDSPVLDLQGLSPERIEQIKSIALALYDAEIAGARAKVAFFGLEAA